MKISNLKGDVGETFTKGFNGLAVHYCNICMYAINHGQNNLQALSHKLIKFLEIICL